MARYPSKVTTGAGQALTLQENSTRGNDVGRGKGLQGPAHPRDYLPATLLNDSGLNELYRPGSLDEPRHRLGISRTQLGPTSNFSAYSHR